VGPLSAAFTTPFVPFEAGGILECYKARTLISQGVQQEFEEKKKPRVVKKTTDKDTGMDAAR
jgi:hypothetical protein